MGDPPPPKRMTADQLDKARERQGAMQCRAGMIMAAMLPACPWYVSKRRLYAMAMMAASIEVRVHIDAP